jgi:hypothetical protein
MKAMISFITLFPLYLNGKYIKRTKERQTS